MLAFRNGSVAEVIEEWGHAIFVESVDEAILKIASLVSLDRGRVRRRFEERFASARMAHDYVRVYQSLSRDARDSTARHRVLNGRLSLVPAAG